MNIVLIHLEENLSLELAMFLHSHVLNMKISKIIWKKLSLKMEK